MIIKTIIGHKVAAIAGALVLGTTTVAAASGNVPFVQDEPEVETAEVIEEAPEETGAAVTPDVVIAQVEEIEAVEEIETEIDESEVQPPMNEDGEAYGDVECDDAENHGEYVSGVAHDDSIEGNKGEIVSQAAKTSCGKDTDDDDEADDSDSDDETRNSDDDDDHDDDDDDDDKKSDDDEHGNGHSNNQGKGNKKDR